MHVLHIQTESVRCNAYINPRVVLKCRKLFMTSKEEITHQLLPTLSEPRYVPPGDKIHLHSEEWCPKVCHVSAKPQGEAPSPQL